MDHRRRRRAAQPQPRPAGRRGRRRGSRPRRTDVDAAISAARPPGHRRVGSHADPSARGGAAGRRRGDRPQRRAWGHDLAVEEGKTQAEGIGEVRRAAQIFRYYGNEGDRQAGEIYASPRAGEQILVTRKPVGVVGIITPFNFPIAIPAWKIAPALIYGNTVVWKPASTVPLLAMRLAQALIEAGLPAGCAQPAASAGRTSATAIVGHRGIDARHVHRLHRHRAADRRSRAAAGCRCRPKWAARTPQWSSTTPTSTWPSSR